MKSYKLFLYFYTPHLVKKAFLGIVLFGLFELNLAVPKITRLASDPYGEITTPLLLSKDGTIVIGKIGEKKESEWPVCFWKNGLITELKVNETIRFLDLQYHKDTQTIVALGNSPSFDRDCDETLSAYAWDIEPAMNGVKNPFFEKKIYQNPTKMNFWISPKTKQWCFLFEDDSWNEGGADILLIEPKNDPFKRYINSKDTLIKYALSKDGVLFALVKTKAEVNYCKNSTTSIAIEKKNSIETNSEEENDGASEYFYRFLMYDLQSKEIKISLPFEKNCNLVPHDVLLTPAPCGVFLTITGKEYKRQDSIFFWNQEQTHSPVQLNLPITLPLGSRINFVEPAFSGKTFVLCFVSESTSGEKVQQFVCYWHVEKNRCDQFFTFNLQDKVSGFKAKTFGSQNQILYLEFLAIQYAQLIFLPEPSSTTLPTFTSLNEWIYKATQKDKRFNPEETNCYLIDTAKVDDSLKSGIWLVSTYPQNKNNASPNHYVIEFKED